MMESVIFLCELDGREDAPAPQRQIAGSTQHDQGAGLPLQKVTVGQEQQEPTADLPGQLPDGLTGEKDHRKSRQHILAWLLLEHALKERYGYALRELDIRRDERGKPFSAAHPEIHFNLSHCAEACACIVGPAPVGIDVERKFRFRDGLTKKICHPDELRKLTPLEGEARDAQIRLLWSLKESYVKMDGRGLGYGMDRANFARVLPVRTKPRAPVLWTGGAADFLLCDQESYTLAACEERDPASSVGDCSGGADELSFFGGGCAGQSDELSFFGGGCAGQSDELSFSCEGHTERLEDTPGIYKEADAVDHAVEIVYVGERELIPGGRTGTL